MKRSQRMTWLSTAGIVGAVLFAGHEMGIGLTTTRFVEAPGVWAGLYGLGMLASFLLLLGIIGLYAYQADQAGGWGVLIFAIALLGLVSFFGFAWSGSVILPAVVTYDPEFMITMVDVWQFHSASLISRLLLAAGIFLFGGMTWRSARLSRPAAGLVMIGSLLGALDAAFNLGALDPPFGPYLLASTGLVWLILDLRRKVG